MAVFLAASRIVRIEPKGRVSLMGSGNPGRGWKSGTGTEERVDRGESDRGGCEPARAEERLAERLSLRCSRGEEAAGREL
jgi:hypothetical protein